MTNAGSYYRRNFACFVADWVGFVTGMAFVSYTSVIPSFVDQLTDFAPLIGLASTIPNGVWLLPQILAANYVAASQRKKPWVVGMGLVGRPMYLLVGLLVFAVGSSYPPLLLSAFFLAETSFSTLDGLSSVAWFDILSRVIPPGKRGRLYTSAQVLTGVLSLGAGAVVGRILGPSGPDFPYNYAVLFCASSGLLLVALGCFSLLKEPTHEAQSQPQPWRTYLPKMGRLFREDRQFRMVNVVRLLMALTGFSIPFYVVHATNVLGLGGQYIGLFVSAQVLGGLIASMAMGYLNEKSGSRIVTQLTVGLGLASPLLALAVHWLPFQVGLTPYVYSLVFLFIGGNYAGYMQGFMNLVLDMAPPHDRPAYIGLYNTLGGTVVSAAPLVGGWILQVASYPVLFSVTAAGIAAALILSFRLGEPRQHQRETGEDLGGTFNGDKIAGREHEGVDDEI